MARGGGDQAVEEMANVNLHVLCFLGLSLEDDVPDHSVLSRFRKRLAKAQAWDALFSETNRQIEGRNLMVKSGCHVDEADAKADMRVALVTQPGVDSEARWLKKAGKSVFGYKQHTVVDANGLVIAVETTPANRYDSQPLAGLVD